MGDACADVAAFEPGSDVGPYRVLRKLGGGGMGTVYEVEHRTLGTRLAMKVFTLEKGDVDFLKNRFLTEGRLLARLRHPRLVRVYDLAVDDSSGACYFTMDLVFGPDGSPVTLEQIRRGGKARDEDAQRWYEELRGGLEAIHAAGIVHRDVKLENVLLDADGHAVLSDFGVARIVKDAIGEELGSVATSSLKTPEDKKVLGTRGYLAPEILDGKPATAAADFYALGFMFFRLLTGVWYEPGTDVFELLAPFDPRWQKVLSALLDPDPAKRGMPPFGGSAFWKGAFRRRCLLVALAAAVIGAGAFLLGRAVSSAPYGVNAPLVVPLSKDVAMEFVACPAGSFQMGRAGDHAADSIWREHKVRITRPFWFGKYPMTVEQWEAATGVTVEMTPAMEAIGKAKLPMNATKGRLMGCCSELTRRFAARLPKGYVFRPPTEAEWEYACRSGGDADDVYNRYIRDDFTLWLYGGGSNVTQEATRHYIYTDRSLAALLRARGIKDVPEFTAASGTRVFGPIGEHRPNAWGIHDLNIGGLGAIALDSLDGTKRGTKRWGWGPGQTALLYADEETDPLRTDNPSPEAFMELIFAYGHHKAHMSHASCRNTIRLVIGPDLVAERNEKPEKSADGKESGEK